MKEDVGGQFGKFKPLLAYLDRQSEVVVYPV